MNNKQIFLLSVIAVIVVGSIGYFYIQRNYHSSGRSVDTATTIPAASTTTPQSADVASQIRVPDGWKTFQLNDDQMGIALAYPEGWQLKEDTSAEYARTISLSGDGYSIDICNACAHDAPTHGFTSPIYFIGGYEVNNTFEFFDGNKYSQTISMTPPFDGRRAKNTLLIRIKTPGNSKEITDRILSSIVFLK